MYRNSKMYFIVFGNVQLNKGAKRCLILDSYRKLYYLIPLGLFNILKKYKNQTISDIYRKFNKNEWSVLDEYFDFLVKEDLVFLTPFISDLKRFKPMSIQWDHYGLITNSVMEFKSMDQFNDRKFVLNQINNLNCMYLQLFFSCTIKFEDFEGLALAFEDTEFRSIEIFSIYNQTINTELIASFFQKYTRISKIVLYCSPQNITNDYLQGFSSLIYSMQKNGDALACGKISPTYFSATVSHYTESQHHNTCLNRKICIDEEGEIKNCPSMPKSYGNIKNTNLLEIINNPTFQEVWHLKKDDITKCKDCEFRHICTDCRAFVDNPEDKFSAPLKCGYNPYTGEWEEWSKNPLKEKAIEFYGLQNQN